MTSTGTAPSPAGLRYLETRLTVNLEAQVTAYEALFRTWWERPWFAGGFLWEWSADDRRRGDQIRADYTHQQKPVEEPVRRWYQGTAAGGARIRPQTGEKP
jgi:hypothetical protein